jgi:hypothetical protein
LYKKQQGGLGLVLRRRRHPTLHRQVREKSRHLVGTHGLRMPLAMEQDETPRPVDIRLLGADRIVQHAHPIAHAGPAGAAVATAVRPLRMQGPMRESL